MGRFSASSNNSGRLIFKHLAVASHELVSSVFTPVSKKTATVPPSSPSPSTSWAPSSHCDSRSVAEDSEALFETHATSTRS